MAERRTCPGLVVLFANGRPWHRVLRCESTLELGRRDLAEEDAEDAMISRQHLRVSRTANGLSVRDLDSRNGSYVAGRQTQGETLLPFSTTLRLGGVVMLAVGDTLPFMDGGVSTEDGVVRSPVFRQTLESIEAIRKAGLVQALLLRGESGSGKEIAAQAFHRAAEEAQAPLVAVNCATIPKDLAERLLFGSRRGVYSGATDSMGYVEAANGGTLFLDEVAELPLELQAKLLRVLETREVVRLGDTHSRRVSISTCCATWKDLRAEVVAGRFRQDLYFRIGQPEVFIPPLRSRREEIPHHVAAALQASPSNATPTPTASFIEACMLRHWPGNVRELRGEVMRAATAVVLGRRASLRAQDLSETAGQPLEVASLPVLPTDEIAEALRNEQGNVLAAARRLGVDRNRVRRWLERHAVSAQIFKS